MPNNVDDQKDAVRARVWTALERAGASPAGVHGSIPRFEGQERAAQLLAGEPPWWTARVMKANPDRAQLAVRARALEDGKLLYMAVPKLAGERPFYVVDPALLEEPGQAATPARARDIADTADVDQLEPVDLVVCGSVAVNREGVRLGKGAGYSDIEVALLSDAGLIGPATTIVTTVHALQVLDEELPETEHDFRVDLIVTPEEVIRCARPRRPGLVWDDLPADKVAAIPALQRRRDAARREGPQGADRGQEPETQCDTPRATDSY